MAAPIPMDQKCSHTLVVADTLVNLTKRGVEWTIHNFSSTSLKNGECLESPKFFIDGGNEDEWYLKLYPKGIKVDHQDHSSIFLKLKSSKKCEVFATCKFSILDKKNQQIYKCETEPRLFKPKGTGYGFPKYTEKKIFTEKAEEILPDGTLTIVAEITVYNDYVNVSRQVKTISVPECSINNDFLPLFTDQKLTDVTLKVGDREIGAHRAILSARSPVFSAMFDHDMKEKENNPVEIVDIDFEVLHAMLEYIYTGRVVKLKDMAKELLRAADKYALERLKNMCEEALSKGLTTENAAQMLIFANLHGAEQLKRETIDFITVHADLVTTTAGWKSMPAYPHLLFELYQELFTLLPPDPSSDVTTTTPLLR